MARKQPDLALDLSRDGIALHQLAFDGHWREMSRIKLSDPILREKMGHMREIARKLEGRSFRNRIWLPLNQVVQTRATLPEGSARARRAAAAAALAEGSPYRPGAFSVAIGAQAEDGSWHVAGVRVSTLIEARDFARAHGFGANLLSTHQPLDGFDHEPDFAIPVNRRKLAWVGGAAAALALVVAGAYGGLRQADPWGWCNMPPEVVETAPNPSPVPGERTGPRAPTALAGLPMLTLPLLPDSLADRDIMVWLPDAQDDFAMDRLREPGTPPLPAAQPESPLLLAALPQVRRAVAELSEPLGQQDPLPAALPDRPEPGSLPLVASVPPDDADAPGVVAAAPDDAQVIVPENTIDLASQAAAPEQTAPEQPGTDIPAARPVPGGTVSRDAAGQVVSRLGAPFDLLTGLPPVPPLLRDGTPLPEPRERRPLARADSPALPVPEQQTPEQQTPDLPSEAADTVPLIAPADAVAPDLAPGADSSQDSGAETGAEQPLPPGVDDQDAANAVPLIAGRPEIVPALRPATDPANDPGTDPGQGTEMPETLPAPEPVTESETDPDTDPQAGTELADAESNAQTGTGPLAQAPVQTGPEAEAPAGDLPGLVEGAPAIVPPLRTGDDPAAASAEPEPEPLVVASATGELIRPSRRPQELARPPEEIVVSGSVPISATRPLRRSADFSARVASIAAARTASSAAATTAAASSAAASTAPPLPQEPQSVALPTTASVARSATIESAINLRQVSLVGIFGTADSLRALIRLSSGRFVRVGVGDSFSGWTVIAIEESQIRVRRGNRVEILRLPG